MATREGRVHATLREVAAKADLSPAAVSRYLNGAIKLPPDTAQRIDDAIAKLNYRPNPHARSLSRGRSDTIGLVVPDIGNIFFAHLAAAIEEAAEAQGYGLVLCVTANKIERELDYIERLSRNYVDALLFVTNHADDGRLAAAIGQAKALVLLDEDVAGAKADKVFADNEGGGALAARHLLEAGHRRLAYIGGPKDLMSARERALGFRAVVADLEDAKTVELFGGYSIECGRSAAAALMDGDAPPTAVFSGSDEITLGALEAFRERGLVVGVDVSLVTFDDVSPLRFFDPPLTAIRQSVGEMGRRGVELVIGQRGEPRRARTERLPVELVRRSSVAPPRQTLCRRRRTSRAAAPL
jgi:LacI family transcriptional regulator